MPGQIFLEGKPFAFRRRPSEFTLRSARIHWESPEVPTLNFKQLEDVGGQKPALQRQCSSEAREEQETEWQG